IVEFSNVKDPSILKRRGLQWLKDQSLMLVTWTVEAIELGLLDKRYELITLGNSYKVDNQFIYAVERLQVIEKKFSILEPQKVTLTIGSKKKKLTDYQNEIKAIQSNLVNVKKFATAGVQNISELIKRQEEFDNDLSVQSSKVSSLEDLTSELSTTVTESAEAFKQLASDLTNTVESVGTAQTEMKKALDDLIKRVEKLEK
ncbi:peptidase M23, partial [Enterococcus faecalis]|nr:peptidase M23 [Enterococcus faecalis]